MGVPLKRKGNTRIHKDNRSTDVVLYDTTIVSFDNNTITLDHGGWKTATTKQRMNQASDEFDLGYYVYRDNYRWYVRFNGKTYDFNQKELILKRV